MPEFSISREGACVKVLIDRNLLGKSVYDLQKALLAEIGTGTDSVVMDLFGADVVDSSGIALMIAASNSMRKVNGKFSVVNASDTMMSIFASMRLTDRIDISERSGGTNG